LTSQSNYNIAYTDNINSFIAEFHQAETRLKLAIEQDDDEKISTAASAVDLVMEQLLNLQCENPADNKKLFEFLVERFVISDNSSEQLRMRVCEKLLRQL